MTSIHNGSNATAAPATSSMSLQVAPIKVPHRSRPPSLQLPGPRRSGHCYPVTSPASPTSPTQHQQHPHHTITDISSHYSTPSSSPSPPTSSPPSRTVQLKSHSLHQPLAASSPTSPSRHQRYPFSQPIPLCCLLEVRVARIHSVSSPILDTCFSHCCYFPAPTLGNLSLDPCCLVPGSPYFLVTLNSSFSLCPSLSL